MAARREAGIYSAFAVLGVAVTAYVLDKLIVLIQRPFGSIDFALISAAAIGLLALTGFYAVLAFVFAVRFIDRVRKDESSLLLCRSDGGPVQVNGNLRVIRRIGKPFSSNEKQSAFVLFLANGRLWVGPQEQIPNGV